MSMDIRKFLKKFNMRNIYKNITIALIFMLIGIFLWQNFAYALRPPLATSETAKDFELINRLSSNNVKEIDEALKDLDEKINDPDKVVFIVERVLFNKGLCLRIGKVKHVLGSAILFIDKEKIDKYTNFNIGVVPKEETAGYRNFIPSRKENSLGFTHGFLFENKKRGQRIFPLMYRWMAAHPYFRNKYSGWKIIFSLASYSAARAIWHSGFEDIKINHAFGEYYEISARFPHTPSKPGKWFGWFRNIRSQL